MATRALRQERIARIIQEHTIWSQQELQERLARGGIEATQATLSRDLTRMGVLKGPAGYVLPGSPVATSAGVTGAGASEADDSMLQRMLRRELRAIEAAGNLVVIRTDAGHASALAVEIDRVRPSEVLGTIAGDDTIFLAARSDAAASRLVRRVRSLTLSN